MILCSDHALAERAASLGGAVCGELSGLPMCEAPNELAQPMLFLVLRDETVRN